MTPEESNRIMEVQQNLGQSLGRVEGKIDLILTQFASHAADDTKEFDTVKNRLSSLEKKIYWLWGVGSAALLAFGYVFGYLTDLHK